MHIYTLTIYITHISIPSHKNKHSAPMPLNGTQLRLNLQPTPLLGKINQWRINGERELRLGVLYRYMCASLYAWIRVCERVHIIIYSKLVR